MKMKRLLFLLLTFHFPAHAFITHYMYGLWDVSPLPIPLKKVQEHNAKALNSQFITHDKAATLKYVLQYSREFDPDFYDLFIRISRKVSQADLGRYLIIFYEGGMYCDLDAIVKDPRDFLEDLSYRNGVWFTEKITDISNLGIREKPYSHRIAQYALFIKDKRSPLMLEIIQESTRRVRMLFEETKGKWSDSDVLWATGPDVVTTIIHETSKSDFKILNLKESQKFINHKGSGGWRKGKDHREFCSFCIKS